MVGELDMLVPCYAATTHRAKDRNIPQLQRNLLYSGVTRGERLVVVVGQKKAVAIAVRNASGSRQWSKLAEWLSANSSKR
jgi:exodeoxyribonuclease V alpha subunit